MSEKELILYIHGKGGSAEESGHYSPLFPGCTVLGLEYRTFTPWEAGGEIRRAVEEMKDRYDRIALIANSIGAYFTLHAGVDTLIRRAWFISPILDMEKLILGMLGAAGVSERELEERGTVPTDFGEELSWEYLQYVRTHPLEWNAPTEILYGSRDSFTDRETAEAFARRHRAGLTVMEGGEHWFHTSEQMAFLDDWLRRSAG